MKWFLGLLLLLLASLALESGLLAYAAYVLLGLLLVSRFLARSWIGNLNASRDCQRLSLEIGQTLTVDLAIRNAGWLPVPWVLLEDLLPRRALRPGWLRLKVKGKRLKLAWIPGRGEIEMHYKIQARMRGYYQVGPLVMETGDLFGLHRRYRVGTKPDFLLVYPRVVPLPGYDLASRRPIGEVRLTHRLYEDPTRIAGVREYQAGDPLNRVHWRATARAGSLHCKVYEPSTLAGATLLLDFHQAGYHQQGEPFRSELAVTAAVSLAHAIYLLGQQVGLVTNGRDAADRIRLEGWEGDFRNRTAAREQTGMVARSQRLQPLVASTGRGAEQFQRLREMLARVELTDGLTFPELILEAASRLPRDATVTAVLPDVPVAAALALGNLRRQGFAVTAVLILMGDEQLEKAFGRLAAEGIRDVRHIKDETGLANLCREQTQGPTPYQFLTELA